MTVRCRLSFGVLFLCLCGMAVTHTFTQVKGDVPPKEIRVTLLGTASGPRAFVDKAGISTLVEAGGERLLFDAGRGFMQRLVQAGFPMNAVSQHGRPLQSGRCRSRSEGRPGCRRTRECP